MRIVDLSLEIVDGARPWKAHPKAIVTEYMTHERTRPMFEPPCEGFATSMLILVDHFGTHMDSPYHFFPELPTTESVSLDTLCGPAVVLDCGAARPADQPVTAAVLERVARERGIDVRPGDIVLVRCFAGEIGEPGWAECRGLSKDAAEWLRDRRVKTVGVDLGTVDDHTDMVRPAHLVLLGASIILLENVANLSQVGQDRCFFVGLPLKIRGGTGSPIRAVALVGDLSPLADLSPLPDA